jgi:putative intracellular protease/amidase
MEETKTGPYDRLTAAKAAADEGRHAEALEEYLWYHDNALTAGRGQGGVRLSYALMFWWDLAQVHAPARQAMEAVRRDKATRLAAGDGDRSLFLDVVSIDRTMENQAATCELLAELAASDPALAQSCFDMALPALVATGNFALAGRFVGDPQPWLKAQSDSFNQIIKIGRWKTAPAHYFEEGALYHLSHVRLMLTVLTGLGRTAELDAIKAQVVDAITDDGARDHFRRALAGQDSHDKGTQMQLSVGIFVFDQVEVLDFAGPYEVFTTASRVSRKLHPERPEPFQVSLVGAGGTAVRARAGLLVQPDHGYDDHGPIDVLIVPGGVVTAALDDSATLAWIGRAAAAAQLTASVCTGAFLLARAGLLNGKAVTTHWEDIDDLKAMFPGLEVRAGLRWVDEGAIVSSAGISAGIDMSLHLVERLAGRALAEATARQMEFDWTENH